MIVAAFITETTGDLSTIILKRTPFTTEEVDRYEAALPTCRRCDCVRAGQPPGPASCASSRAASEAEADAVAAATRATSARSPTTRRSSGTSPLRRRVAHIFKPLELDNPEDSIGERVLLLCSSSPSLFAAVFLLAPFLFVRREWRRDPSKGTSARLLRGARARLHVLRDHDDPAARAVPRLPDLLAHGHARVDPRLHRDRRAR